ncbi:sigma-70 family RNA polymerase sigma factor [uncultured Cellulomonas sp.]|uniref:RNA polymerase sigma factor n=1 Tax=uncultured Cellulomonas sp. TaxID=189682 RepID=UPI0028E51043|nr:sigma-70 family RNA polymerase sigma factor [uncultured Cellulomonas sp.]
MGDDRLAALARERGPNLVAYAYLLTGDDASAQDVVQEALVRTFSRRRSGADVEWLEAYVRRAILHVYLDGYRKRRRWSVLAPVLAEERVAPEGPDVTAVRRADVRAALAMLAPQQRAAVVLHHVDDLSVREVAASMEVSEGTVKRYLHEARQKLGSLLAHDDGDRIDVTTVWRPR